MMLLHVFPPHNPCCVYCVMCLSGVVQVWLPQGTAMFACIYSLHRDPDFWPDALEFKPERWLPVRAGVLLVQAPS